jgi:EAL domain-containing protein (putative c-di-GMP-specific phosphodiesterase class I)
MSNQAHLTESRNLLVIDDDLAQCVTICEIGSRAGFRPSGASCFEEAVRHLERSRFDCITLDLSLGERSGAELLRTIAEIDRHAPIILISGVDRRIQSSTLRIARSLGLSTRSLPKPISPPELRTALLSSTRTACAKSSATAGGPDITVADLENAFKNDEFSVAFQPKILLATGSVVGFEALARWSRPGFGNVPPVEFIPAIDRAELQPALMDLVLRKASETCLELSAHNPDFSIAVNVSPLLLSDLSLPNRIIQVLDQTGLPPEKLILEVTEETAMSDIDKAMEILVQLRLRGIGISIDDFGTGYSSLVALSRMPFSEMKIDRSFVQNCDWDADDWKVVRSSVLLAHEFGMKVVAEGIETSGVCERLADIGCDIGQGYLFSPPLNASAMASWLTVRRHAPPSQATALPVGAR